MNEVIKKYKRKILLGVTADKQYRAEIEVELKLHRRHYAEQRDIDLNPVPDTYAEFTVCGTIDAKERGRFRDYSGGQNLDEIAALYPDNALVQEIVGLWNQYHLNGLKAGSRPQTEFIKQYEKDNPSWRYDYSAACDLLRDAGLYIDRGYKYGHAWLLEILPEEVKNRIMEIIKAK